VSANCSLCGKKPSRGRTYVRRGIAKKKGGIGLKIDGKTKRWFKPNLQQIKVCEKSGHVHRAWVCTQCIRSGKVTKAPKQSLLAKARAEEKANP
jgi:large subunit ribosomal protein L28